MKIVIKRHLRDYQVFRVCAVAQAIAARQAEVDPNEPCELYVECLSEHKAVLDLFPSLKWKDPHRPYQTHKIDAKGLHVGFNQHFDKVIDLDAGGPFEARWTTSGLDWWAWISQCVSQYEGDLAIPEFPTLERAPVQPSESGEFVVVSPTSDESDFRDVSFEKVCFLIRSIYPGIKIVTVYGPPAKLAAHLWGAKAVFAVNGLAAALSQSLWGEKPLVTNLYFINPPDRRTKDPFASMRAMIKTGLGRPPGSNPVKIIDTTPDLSLSLRAAPA